MTYQAEAMGKWYIAKTKGLPSRAAFYLERDGITAFVPVIHKYFVDKRKSVEKHRVACLFPGYVFFLAYGDRDFGRVKSSIGIADILGDWRGEKHVAVAMPDKYMIDLIANCPIIEGKRNKFCTGDLVKIAIAGVRDIIARVERHDGRRVHVKVNILGIDIPLTVSDKDIRLAV